MDRGTWQATVRGVANSQFATEARLESGKMVPMNLSAGQIWRHRHRGQTDGHGGGEGGTEGESSMETYTPPCVK